MSRRVAAGAGALAGVAALAARDVLQREHAVIRNFPLVGRLRYLLEAFASRLREVLDG